MTVGKQWGFLRQDMKQTAPWSLQWSLAHIHLPHSKNVKAYIWFECKKKKKNSTINNNKFPKVEICASIEELKVAFAENGLQLHAVPAEFLTKSAKVHILKRHLIRMFLTWSSRSGSFLSRSVHSWRKRLTEK